ncbi:MAG: molecular chaperone TorD family protein [Thermodesulfovibrionales bacterium]
MNKRREKLLTEADIYRLLSLSFAYPGRETMETLRCIVDDIGEVIDSMKEEFILFKNSLNSISSDELEGEFTELFMTRMLCPPYENSYGKIGSDKSKNLADINGFYKAFGLSISDSDSDMPDHIAVEMEFLSLLALKEAYGIERDIGDMVEVCSSAKNKFLKDHIGRWAGTFCKNLMERTTNDFYRNLALLASRFIEGEIRFYGLTVEPAEETLQESLEPMVCPAAGREERDNYMNK